MVKLYTCSYCSNDYNNDFKNMTRKEYFKHSKNESHIIRKLNIKEKVSTTQKLKIMDKMKNKMTKNNYINCKNSNFNYMMNLVDNISLERNDSDKIICSLKLNKK